MNAIEQKRQALIKVSPRRQWQQRVIKMPEAQVVAIYLRLQQQNKL